MSEETEEIVKIEVMSNDIVYAQDRAQVDVQIATAKQFPRSIKKATENALAIVTISEEIAKTCNYALPRGGKNISGPSVHLARILAQTWGNMRIEAKVISIDTKQIVSQAVAFDLENNLAIKVEVRRSIVGKSGRFNDDMITVTGNAANAIALRNAILAVIPKGIIDEVYNASKQKITGDLSDKTKLIAKRKKVVDALKETFGVSEKEIFTAVGRQSIDHIDAEDIGTLIGIGQAIKDGDTTVELAFKQVTIAEEKKSSQEKKIKSALEIPTVEELKELLDKHYEAMDSKDIIEVRRIIDAGEEKSYGKAKELILKKKD